MPRAQTINEMTNGVPLNFVDGVASKKVTENDEQEVSSAGVITLAKKDVSRCSAMEFWFYATTAAKNLAGGDSLTVKLYKRVGGVDFLVETLTVTTPAVTALTGAKVDLVSANPIESYEIYTVEGTITLPSGGTAKLVVGKKSQGTSGNSVTATISGTVTTAESAPTIAGNASAAITEASSTVTLTQKSEVRNTGTNTVYLAEGGGTAVAATDFPLYPDETITLKAGTFDAVCGAGLTSTLSILKVS